MALRSREGLLDSENYVPEIIHSALKPQIEENWPRSKLLGAQLLKGTAGEGAWWKNMKQ